jgi:hypothetical protein
VEDVHIGYCREVARSVARRHGVTAPPVDVEAIAVREGMRIVRVDLGALEGRMREDDDGWLIEVNCDRSLTSQRFSVGHELGHRKMGHLGCGTDAKQEREANLFAAELLIPLALLKKAMAKHRSLGDLAGERRRRRGAPRDRVRDSRRIPAMDLVASMPMDDRPEQHAEVNIGWAASGPTGCTGQPGAATSTAPAGPASAETPTPRHHRDHNELQRIRKQPALAGRKAC